MDRMWYMKVTHIKCMHALACFSPRQRGRAGISESRILCIRLILSILLSFRIPPPRSQARIYRFAFESQDAEDALVHASQWLQSDESLQRLHTERKLAGGH